MQNMTAHGYGAPERACDVCFANRKNCVTSPESSVQTGSEFKADLALGKPKFGIFLNSASPTVAEQFAHAGYDWLLVDCQHGPMESVTMSAMLCAISSGGVKSMVRVAGYDDRNGIQQALDLGADGILIPYINTAEEAAAGVSCWCVLQALFTLAIVFWKGGG
jgi:4-hydroxy-2-oxoheptanedioate aldolase